jgi:hypothetical protein
MSKWYGSEEDPRKKEDEDEGASGSFPLKMLSQ